MTTYRTLMIAPATDLALQDDEVMQIVNTLGARLLQGSRANLHGLIDIFREDWDILWFASHGSKDGIHLSDGVLKASEVTALIRGAGVRLTVFNTCESYEVAHAIHQELDTEFICSVKPLPDRSAYLTGSLFAQHLARGLSFRQAYEAARPGQNSTYVFLGDREQLMPPPRERGRGDVGPTAKLEEVVEQLDVLVNGSPRFHTVGLVESNRSVVAKVDSMAVDLAKLKDDQRLNRRLLVFLACINACLVIAVFWLIFIPGGG